MDPSYVSLNRVLPSDSLLVQLYSHSQYSLCQLPALSHAFLLFSLADRQQLTLQCFLSTRGLDSLSVSEDHQLWLLRNGDWRRSVGLGVESRNRVAGYLQTHQFQSQRTIYLHDQHNWIELLLEELSSWIDGFIQRRILLILRSLAYRDWMRYQTTRCESWQPKYPRAPSSIIHLLLPTIQR